jgi:predicted small secreted protein
MEIKMKKIAVVILLSLFLSGCAGLGLAGVIMQSLGDSMDGGSGQVYYRPAPPRPVSYTCYQNGPWTNCDPD